MFRAKLDHVHLSIYCLDQVWRRDHWDSPVDRLHSITRKRGISRAKDWPHTHQGFNNFCTRHSIISSKDHFKPTTIEDSHLKQQCSVMVADHIPWWRASNLERWCWQCFCSHQGRQLTLDSLNEVDLMNLPLDYGSAAFPMIWCDYAIMYTSACY